MKKRLCSIFLTLALICTATIFPASAAGSPVVTYQLAADGYSAHFTLEGSELSLYGFQLALTTSSTGADCMFTPDATDPGLASQSSVLRGDAGDQVTVYLTSPYSLGQGASIPMGTLSATEKLSLPTQGKLILLDAQLGRHEYTVSLHTAGGEMPDPTPTPAPTAVPSSPDSSPASSSSGGSSTKSLNVTAGDSGLVTLTQSTLKEAKSLTVKGPATLAFDPAALKALQRAGGTVSIGVSARTEMLRPLAAQLNGAKIYDITLTAGGTPLTLGSGRVNLSVPFTGNGTPVAYSVGQNGQLSKLANATQENGSALFSLSGDIQGAVTVLDVAQVFPDVNGWYDGYVNTVTSSQIMKGMEDGRFQPDKTMTRAELVTTLYRMSGDSADKKNPYQDVSPDDWFADAVSWAKTSGVTSGVSETAFAPNQSVTREQTAAMLSRFISAKGLTLTQETPREQFADEAQISAFAQDAVGLMQRMGILSGKGNGRFDPQGTATRAECAKMLAIVLSAVEQ